MRCLRIVSSIDVFSRFQEAKMSQIKSQLKSPFQKTTIIFQFLFRCSIAYLKLICGSRKKGESMSREEIFDTLLVHSVFWGIWVVSYIINHSLNKLFRLRCLDNGFFFFCVSVDTDFGSVYKNAKKNSANIRQSWPPAWSLSILILPVNIFAHAGWQKA